MLIDTHQHFWRYTTDEFGWIPDEMAIIRRDFFPADLAPLLAANHVDGVIAVQARQTEAETRWLLELADHHPFIHGVVGWLDLRSPNISNQLNDHAGGALVGLRHVLQGEPDAFMEDVDFNRGLTALADANLAYDLLILEKQLPAAIALVDRHPQLRFILDHFGKPRIDVNEIEPWKTHLRELSRRSNVWCKISGGITEAALDWTPHRLRPCLDTSLEAFGPNRLIFGSNWPVCEAAGGYGPWIDAIRRWASALSLTEQDTIFGDNAMEFYLPKRRNRR
jgi:L-fuconolactonase